MKIRMAVVISMVAMIGYASGSAAKNDPFSPAKDLPRGALVYVQISDLPALIKRWKESPVTAKYLDSRNFHDLANRHLGLKLASRWQEFSDAAGFPFDLETVAGFADGRASIAIYDIGKLDLVFIAPVSDELFAATRLVQNGSRFEEEDLGDDITAYRVAVEADRGRQKQEILFTHLKGRLIVATSEKLLAKTIANVTGRSSKDRLSDEPTFSRLSDRITPHLATVWVDQAALNDDYYFKRYWLIKDAAKLKNVRAGIFDLSIDDGKVTESREFLLGTPEQPQSVSIADGRELLSHVPGDAALFQMSAANNANVDDAIKVVLEIPANLAKASERTTTHSFFRDDSVYYLDEGRFRDLGSDFDQNIDDQPDDSDEIVDEVTAFHIAPTLAAVRPTALLLISQPKMLAKSLFAEFNYAAALRLGAPATFDREAFESAIRDSILQRVVIPEAAKMPEWTTQSEDRFAFRELSLPMLDRKISYVVAGGILFLGNSHELMEEIQQAKNSSSGENLDKALSDWRVLDVNQSREQFEQLFDQLQRSNSDDFFTGNIDSVLASVSNADRVEIKRYTNNIFTHEDVTMYLK